MSVDMDARAELGVALLRVERLETENLRLVRELRERNEDLEGFRLAGARAVGIGDGPAATFLPRIVILESIRDTRFHPYGLVAIPLSNCFLCNAVMAQPSGGYRGAPFDQWSATAYETQITRARWEIVANVRTLGRKKICRACAKADKGLFRCDLCEKERPTSQVKERYGDPEYREEYLCTPCFETVTAKVWDEKCDELRESHRYDSD